MPIPNAGLSHLADVAREVMQPNSPGAHHYPIRKKGEPRRLDPNQAGINWLEEHTAHDTEIVFRRDEKDGHQTLIARGWSEARQRGMHPRRMIDLFEPGQSSTLPIAYSSPCPDCDDWARTAQCEVHHEHGPSRYKESPTGQPLLTVFERVAAFERVSAFRYMANETIRGDS